MTLAQDQVPAFTSPALAAQNAPTFAPLPATALTPRTTALGAPRADERAAVLPPRVRRPDRDAAQHRRVAVLVEHRDADDDAAELENHACPLPAGGLEPLPNA